MNAFKVTYTDGTHYTTNANGTAAEFQAIKPSYIGFYKPKQVMEIISHETTKMENG